MSKGERDRDNEADRAAFLSSDPDYGDRIPIRRHAAADRGNAKDDRHHSADDREKLTQDAVEEPG